MNIANMTGMSREPIDGRFVILDSLDHIRQSIRDIVTTSLGSRVMRPDYGSNVPRLVDQPANQAWKLRVYVAVAEAVRKWEPRVKIERTIINSVAPGKIDMTVEFSIEGQKMSESFEVNSR